jgi:DNA-binding response OmpR family regulator
MARVVIVDDEPEVGEVIRRVLERAGYDTAVSHSAAAALEAIKVRPPDVVVTDIIMPKTNGVELIKTLRAEYPRVRVIAISGGGSFGPLTYKPDAISTHAFLAAARDAGADEILTKPFDLSELLAAIRRQLPN